MSAGPGPGRRAGLSPDDGSLSDLCLYKLFLVLRGEEEGGQAPGTTVYLDRMSPSTCPPVSKLSLSSQEG